MFLIIKNLLKKNWFPKSVLFVSLLFTLFLLTFLQKDVFFAGDMGLKLLQVKQFQAGLLHFNLDLPAPDWAGDLWNQGLYPFHPEFVYQLDGQKFIHYPFLFAWLTTPFYAWLGFWGLHLIPLVSVWVVWLIGYRLCQRLEFTNLQTSLAILSLAPASPLTLYSSLFWEHAPAVALAMGGFGLIWLGFRENISIFRAGAAGLLIGISAWLRPEILCLAVGLIMLFPFLGFFKLNLKHRWIIALSAVTPIVLFFLTNYLLYGHPLGLQGRQVVEGRVIGREAGGFSLIGQMLNAVRMAENMGRLTLVYFPVAFAAPLIRFLKPRNSRPAWLGEYDLMLVLCALFFAGTAVILPLGAWDIKQWGPRYLLPLVCILALCSGKIPELLKQTSPFKKKAGIALLTVALGWGLVINSYYAAAKLSRDFSTRIKPTLELLNAAPEPAVAVSIQHIAQELAALIGPKTFFLAKNPQALEKIASAVKTNNMNSFIYIRHIDRQGYDPANDKDALTFSLDGRHFQITFENLGRSAKYDRYRAVISPVGQQ